MHVLITVIWVINLRGHNKAICPAHRWRLLPALQIYDRQIKQRKIRSLKSTAPGFRILWRSSSTIFVNNRLAFGFKNYIISWIVDGHMKYLACIILPACYNDICQCSWLSFSYERTFLKYSEKYCKRNMFLCWFCGLNPCIICLICLKHSEIWMYEAFITERNRKWKQHKMTKYNVQLYMRKEQQKCSRNKWNHLLI